MSNKFTKSAKLPRWGVLATSPPPSPLSDYLPADPNYSLTMTGTPSAISAEKGEEQHRRMEEKLARLRDLYAPPRVFVSAVDQESGTVTVSSGSPTPESRPAAISSSAAIRESPGTYRFTAPAAMCYSLSTDRWYTIDAGGAPEPADKFGEEHPEYGEVCL